MRTLRRAQHNLYLDERDEFYHPDIRGQEEFIKKVRDELRRRRERRRREAEMKARGPQLPKFEKTKKPSFQKNDYDYDIQERKMTASEIKREARLKTKYDDSEMKASMISQYGPEKGKQIYFATIRKQAMKEDFELDEAKISRTERRRINQEKQKGRSKGAVHAFDVDETLFSHGVKGKPNVQVHVNDSSGKRVKSLSNQEFNTHKLEPGHSYDFSEFRSSKKFSQTASPNKRVISQLKRLQKRGKNVHLVTARDKFDNPEEFRRHFSRYGINMKPGNIHYTGGMKGEKDIGKKKVSVAKGIAKMGDSKEIHMYDDAAKVHKAFEAEKKKSGKLKIKTHLAKPNKKGEVMTRSYQATKEDFELWIQDILSEGYDLSELTIDELYDIYEELMEDEPSIIPYVSPYKNINESVEEEVELTPYDYWKSFIDEDINEAYDNDDELEEEYEEEVELTPYELWKLYAIQSNIQEQDEDEEEGEQDPRRVQTSYNVTANNISQRQRQKRKRQIAANLRYAANEMERD
jgi:hypothetical protein